MSLSSNTRKGRALALIGLSVVLAAAAGVVFVAPSFRALQPAARPPVAARVTADGETIRIYFLDADHGWAAAAAPLSGTRMLVYSTSDGARSWQQTGVIPGLSDAYAVSDFEFFDRSNGVISIAADRPAAYRTSNGGRTWTPFDLPPGSRSLTFVDRDHAWATTAPVLMRAYATSDRGATWNALPKLPVDGGLDFSSRLDAWMADLSRLPIVYVTHDAGHSWQQAGSLPQPPPGQPGFFSDYPPAFLAAGGEGAVVADFQDGAEFITLDGGFTWRYVGPPPGIGNYSDISYQDLTHWWVIRGNDLYKTADAGVSWTLVSTRIPYDTVQPTILDARHAWALVQQHDDSRLELRQNVAWSLEVTSDGGLTWKDAVVPVPD